MLPALSLDLICTVMRHLLTPIIVISGYLLNYRKNYEKLKHVLEKITELKNFQSVFEIEISMQWNTGTF